MWGISYMNLQMLAGDAVEYFSDYSTKNNDGQKKQEVINADDPRNKEKMYRMLGW